MKRALSLALLVLGTIVGTLGGAHLPSASWSVVGAGLVLLAAGAVVGRRSGGARATAAAAAERDAIAALVAAPASVDALSADAPSLALSDLRRRIDRLDVDVLQPIAEASPLLLPVLGASLFAEVFSAFASGERQLARAWSAAADGHSEEALASVVRGAERIRAAATAMTASAQGQAARD